MDTRNHHLTIPAARIGLAATTIQEEQSSESYAWRRCCSDDNVQGAKEDWEHYGSLLSYSVWKHACPDATFLRTVAGTSVYNGRYISPVLGAAEEHLCIRPERLQSVVALLWAEGVMSV